MSRSPVEIGERLIPRRGRADLQPITVRQIHRADRCAQVVTDDGHRETIHFGDLRRKYRPEHR